MQRGRARQTGERDRRKERKKERKKERRKERKASAAFFGQWIYLLTGTSLGPLPPQKARCGSLHPDLGLRTHYCAWGRLTFLLSLAEEDEEKTRECQREREREWERLREREREPAQRGREREAFQRGSPISVHQSGRPWQAQLNDKPGPERRQ